LPESGIQLERVLWELFFDGMCIEEVFVERRSYFDELDFVRFAPNRNFLPDFFQPRIYGELKAAFSAGKII